ncbi:MAG: Lrp/AsnC ligand binding domain-containing protein [Thermoplasmatota archaeon]
MKIKIRKRYLFFVLAFTSALISAALAGYDAYVQLFIENPWVFGLSLFVVTLIITIIISLILSIPIKGKSLGALSIDPTFQRVRLIQKEEVVYHILAGAGNAVLTTGYFILLSMLRDPSVVLPFSQVAILYLVIIESITEKNNPTLVEFQSSIIVTFGAILGSISLTGSISLKALAIVFLVINPGWVLLSIYQRKLKTMKLKDKKNDSINIRLYNVIFALIFTSIFVAIYDYISNSNILYESIVVSFQYFHLLAIMGIGTFLSFVFYIRALGIGKASVTQAVRSSIIIFSIPVSLVLAYIGIIEPFSTDPILLLIKFIGIIIMMLGIISFALTLTKAYIFITMKPGIPIEETMKRLWEINGVNRVCAVTGKYDFIIKIRTRTLIKGYERIIRKVESIEGVEEFKWQSVLKDWEDI